MQQKVYFISLEDAADIVENPKCSNRQMFVTKLQKRVKKPWLAIDNTNGTAATETFSSREEAEHWLNGE